MPEEDAFDYASEMKEYYRSEEVASSYHDAYGEDGHWRHRLIASRERAVVESLVSAVPCETVLDLPTGTGKLAPVFAETGSAVLACDISEAMLGRAEREYARAGVVNRRFAVCDATSVSEVVGNRFDVAVCLRLLHRVPTDVKRRILSELAAVADHVVVSTGIESPFHAARRRLRYRLLGGDERGHCYETAAKTRDLFTREFDVLDARWVLPVLSQERVYLLRS
ncbi:class I SAM-dependent methyltransferase [Halovivax limisalsi]|uniref:class I SAM-dependent methyltransferase n=1 Tax=Halovivax limisalsi TaxID=1453760 RepID=UPI001FFD653E|nr:class I SAM-dependent methyltransferase [Halovivax limisalsi]